MTDKQLSTEQKEKNRFDFEYAVRNPVSIPVSEAADFIGKIPTKELLALNGSRHNAIDTAIIFNKKEFATAIINRQDITAEDLFSRKDKESTINIAVRYGRPEIIRNILLEEGVTEDKILQLRKDITLNNIAISDPVTAKQIVKVIDEVLFSSKQRVGPEILKEFQLTM